MAESYLMPMPTAIPIDEALLWNKIGAIGTLVGSAFSFIAIIISIVAFFYPRKIKIDASVTLETIEKICIALDCEISDVVSIKKS